MIRYFCDCCGKEIPAEDATFRNPLWGRLSAELKRGNSALRVSVIEYKDNVGNSGQFCRYCVLDALRSLDDRPVPDHSILDQTFHIAKLLTSVRVKAWLEVRDSKVIGMHQVSETKSNGRVVESPAKETGVIASLK